MFHFSVVYDPYRWPDIAEWPSLTEQHPGSREFTDDDESAPPHFTEQTSYESEDEDE